MEPLVYEAVLGGECGVTVGPTAFSSSAQTVMNFGLQHSRGECAWRGPSFLVQFMCSAVQPDFVLSCRPRNYMFFDDVLSHVGLSRYYFMRRHPDVRVIAVPQDEWREVLQQVRVRGERDCQG